MSIRRQIGILPTIEAAVAEQNWDELSKLLNPKLFTSNQPGDLIAPQVLAKVAQILMINSLPDKIKISCLKCLGNSCFNGYKYKEFSPKKSESDVHCHDLYLMLAQRDENSQSQSHNSYPYNSHFPYEKLAEWTSDYIVSYFKSDDLSDSQLQILRLSIQFLCNFFTFACKDDNFPEQCNIPGCLRSAELINAIINCTQFKDAGIVKAACIFIHNALKELPDDYFSKTEKIRLYTQLLKPLKEGYSSAREALLFLLSRDDTLRNFYIASSANEKLALLELIYNEMSDYGDRLEEKLIREEFAEDTITFLMQQVCQKSDLMVNNIDELEPREIVMLLEVLGAVTATDSKYKSLLNDKTFLMNIICLLKTVQAIGKAPNNCFTPIQRLSDVAPSTQAVTVNQGLQAESGGTGHVHKRDFWTEPFFGVKTALIRIIGNLCYRNKINQDLLREMDAIPLLLDCCNIDARNPLIMQWTIFALRNACEGNLENQEIIRNCTKVGVAEVSLLTEMGLTLHEKEDGEKIGIVPLVRDKRD